MSCGIKLYCKVYDAMCLGGWLDGWMLQGTGGGEEEVVARRMTELMNISVTLSQCVETVPRVFAYN